MGGIRIVTQGREEANADYVKRAGGTLIG